MRPGHHRRQRRSVWSWSLPLPPARLVPVATIRNVPTDEIGSERRQAIGLIFRIGSGGPISDTRVGCPKETGLTRQTIYRIKDDPAGSEAALAAWERR
jgi:hypothetical protein